MAENTTSTTKTPIEENSDLIAEVQSLVDNLPEAGGTDISLGVTGASVGDIVKVKAVDENGKPTEWEAAVLDSDKPWTKIIDVEITEPTLRIEATDLDSCTEFIFFWSQLETTGEATCGFNVNGVNVISHGFLGITVQGANKMYGYTVAKFDGVLWQIYKTPGTLSTGTTRMQGGATVPYYVNREANAPAMNMFINCFSSSPIVSGRLEVYAK